MSSKTVPAIIAVLVLLQSAASAGNLSFVESGDTWGLTEPLKGIMAHAAACGDLDGDRDLDLYVGNFCDRPPEQYLGVGAPVPNMLLINDGGRFTKSDQPQLAIEARTSGAVFVDFDNDGDLDLYVSNNSKSKGLRVANALFENIDGQFRRIAEPSDAQVIMGGRSIAVLDYDGDTLLDMLVAEDKWTGRRTRLLRNAGGFRFEDVSDKVGLPADLPGLGVITPDLNEDGRPDIFIGQCNRLFLSNNDATYTEGDYSVFQYEPINNEATPCGVACGDLNRDGLTDIVIVDHSQPARQHLYINLGLADGVPRFMDATAEAGLDYLFPSWTPEKLHLKHAHVEIADFDNDGWPDIFPAATYRRADSIQPFICRNTTASQSIVMTANVTIPQFDVPPVQNANTYFAAGPVADYDRDGRLDMFLASWFPQIPSKLFLNRSAPNHWLNVKIVGSTINRMGIGTTIKVYPPGALGRPDKLIGCQHITISQGFCSGHEAVAHFGLADLTQCDLEINLPFNKATIRRKNVQANRLIIIEEPPAPN